MRINKLYSEITHDDIINFMYEYKISVVHIQRDNYWVAYKSHPELSYKASSIKQAVYDCYVAQLVI